MACDIPMLDIELVRGCNLACRWCSVKKGPLHPMAPELFKVILRECAQKSIGYRRVSLFLGGEPLLHPEFPDLCRILSRELGTNPGFSHVQLFTNGVTNPNFYQDILKVPITLVRFSIDGVGDKHSYEYMRPGTSWKMLKENIKYMVALRNAAGSALGLRATVLIPDQSFVPFPVPPYGEAVKRIHALIASLGLDGAGCRRIGTLIGKDIALPDHYYEHKRICLLVKDRKLVVNHDGSVSTCSNDLNGDQLLGHVSAGGLEAVWQSATFQDFLRKKQAGQKHPRGYCRGCDRNNV